MSSVRGITLIITGVGVQLQALNILQLECGYIKRHKTNYNWGGSSYRHSIHYNWGVGSVTGTILIITGEWVQ